MMKRFLGIAFLLAAIAAAPARAQYSTVSGTVTDSQGIPYGGATIKFQLSTPGATLTINDAAKCQSAGQGSAPCHVPITGTYGPTTLDSTGHFTIVVPDNAFVLPASPSSVYLITVTISPGVFPPFGTGSQTFTNTQAITGATVNIGSTLSGLAPALTNTPPGSGNVSTADTLIIGDVIVGAGAKTIHDSGVPLAGLAPLASPAFTGVPTAPTAAPGTATTQIATMAALQAAAGVKTLSTNITPVTISGATLTSLQNLQAAAAIAAGAENTLGKTFGFHTGGTMITAAGKIEFTFTLGTGSAGPAISGFTPGSPGNSYNFTIDGTCTTTTTGATGQLLCLGQIAFGGASGNTSQDSSISPFNFTITGANLTGALTLQMQALFDTTNAGSTATENLLAVSQLN